MKENLSGFRPPFSVFALSFCFLLSHFVCAQVAIGLNGGVNQAIFFKKDQSLIWPLGSYNAGQAGLSLKGCTPNGFNMCLELNYRRKSDQLDISNSWGMAYTNELKGHFRLDYGSVLVLPEYRWGKTWEGFVNAGFYLGKVFHATFIGDDLGIGLFNNHPPRYQVQEDPSSYFKDLDGGLVAGAGLSYAINDSWKASLGFRYFLGFQSQDFGCLAGISKTIQWQGLRKFSDYMAH